jgi:hypothetical protein
LLAVGEGFIPHLALYGVVGQSVHLLVSTITGQEADERFPHPPFDVVDLDASPSPFISRPVELAPLVVTIIAKCLADVYDVAMERRIPHCLVWPDMVKVLPCAPHRILPLDRRIL